MTYVDYKNAISLEHTANLQWFQWETMLFAARWCRYDFYQQGLKGTG